MDIKRVLTAIFGLPVVILIIVFGNEILMNILLAAIAIICMHEYLGVVGKIAKPIKWIAYLSTLSIALVSFISIDLLMKAIVLAIPIILLILFFKVIVTDMKTDLKDVAYTFLGIFYITFFIMFLALIRGLEYGKTYIGYTIIVAWATDIFAYLIGKHFGKHKFSTVSPNKTIEGCVAGTVSAAIVCLIYTYCINTFLGYEINMFMIGVVSIILSIAGQIGDFSASVIKRNFDVKDYSNLFPGHGGMLDRIDSLMFIAPVTFAIFGLFLI